MITNEVEKAVQYISKKIDSILKEKEYVVIAVSGGRSVKTLFEEFIKSNIDWKKIHFFMVDERMISIESEQSNFKLVKEQLFEKIDIPDENLHPFDIEKGIESYEKELKKYDGMFDIIVLGVGEDGHVGALYPNYTIENESEYFFTFNDSPKPPSERMTSSRKLLMKSKLAVAIFLGEEKKEAYKKFNDESVSIEKCPAKLVKKMDNIVFIDLE